MVGTSHKRSLKSVTELASGTPEENTGTGWRYFKYAGGYFGTSHFIRSVFWLIQGGILQDGNFLFCEKCPQNAQAINVALLAMKDQFCFFFAFHVKRDLMAKWPMQNVSRGQRHPKTDFGTDCRSLSMTGALRSLTMPTFFSLAPLWMSDSRAPLPLTSDELSLGAVVLACRKRAGGLERLERGGRSYGRLRAHSPHGRSGEAGDREGATLFRI